MRLLRADEIDCRVGQVFKKQEAVGCLLYKDARVDMQILDEEFGVNGWQRTHEVIDGQLYCNIDVWCNEKKCWVRKQDVGVESMTEKEKGRASDSFKRAGFNVGIGRELYTAPFIYIKLSEYEFNNGKPRINLRVKEIGYENRKINHLVIVDKDDKVRFSMGSGKPKKTTTKKATTKPKDIIPDEVKKEIEGCMTLEGLKEIQEKYAILDVSDLLNGRYKQLKNK